MGARQKLNSAYLTGGLVIAGVVAALAQSWTVFLIAAIVMIVTSIGDGSIRPTRRR